MHDGVLEPVEIDAREADHFVREVGAVDGVAEEGGFLEDDAGAAEWVKEAGCSCRLTIFWKRPLYRELTLACGAWLALVGDILFQKR
jgi:hypothetical protein